MKNEDLLQRIFSLYSKGVHTSDVRLTRRHIYHKLLTTRNLLLTQQANKRQRIGREAYQILPCIVMEKVPITECDCIPAFLLENCQVMRSQKKLPKIIKSIHSLLVSDVTTVDGQIRLDIENYAALKYYKGRKYGLGKPFVFIFDDYLFMINAEYELLQLVAVFSEPLKIFEFISCDCDEEVDCESYLEKDFPIPNSMEESLLAMARDELLIIFQHGKIDRANNSQDNSNQQQQIEQ